MKVLFKFIGDCARSPFDNRRSQSAARRLDRLSASLAPSVKHSHKRASPPLQQLPRGNTKLESVFRKHPLQLSVGNRVEGFQNRLVHARIDPSDFLQQDLEDHLSGHDRGDFGN